MPACPNQKSAIPKLCIGKGYLNDSHHGPAVTQSRCAADAWQTDQKTSPDLGCRGRAVRFADAVPIHDTVLFPSNPKEHTRVNSEIAPP